MLTKKQICSQIKPGRCTSQQKGLGGCAFDGAQIVLVPITDAAHLVHGPADCTANSWNTRGSLSSASQLYRRCFTTDLTENDIVFGGEEKLKRSIEYVAKRYTPAAIFVYSTCVTALTGEDIVLVCREMSRRVPMPVIPVESPGYAGSKNFGNRVAGETLLEYVIGTKEPTHTTPYDLNLIGEYNIAGELWNITRLLKSMGIRVMSVMTGDSSYQDIAASHRAKLNVMVCGRALLSIAERMKERYGIPWLEESFFGIENTSRALMDIAGRFDDPELIRRTGSLIEKEESAARERLAAYLTILEGKRVLLYTGGVKSWSVISALHNLGMEVVGCGIRKSTDEDVERITGLLSKDAVLLENTSPAMLVKMAGELGADMIVAGGRNQYTAIKARIPYLDINQDREVDYTGYEGAVNLAGRLAATLSAPVWEKVSVQNAPIPLFYKKSARKKPVTIDPLKPSPAMGAVIAFLGIHNGVPLMHGCQGCTAFVKAMLNRHFREPAYVHTTALMETDVIMDGGDTIIKSLDKIREKLSPEIIGVITTGLTEVKGDDVSGVIREYNKSCAAKGKMAVIPVSTPDYEGSMQEGYAKAVAAIIESSLFVCGDKDTTGINFLPGSFLTPADIIELKEVISSFGLHAVVLPDISGSLDGHLDREVRFIAQGGTKIKNIPLMGSSAATISIGESMKNPANALEKKTGVVHYHMDSVFGLKGFDRFVEVLSQISGNPVPEKLKRERSQLTDAMLDSYFYISKKRFALALEPDLTGNISPLILEVGGEIALAVTTAATEGLRNIRIENLVEGDLEDLEQYGEGTDMVIANSNAVYAAKALKVPLLRTGFPVVDRLGVNQKLYAGYRGAMNFMFEIGNIFIERKRA